MRDHFASDMAGENIRLARKRLGWSVAELARRVEQLGERINAPVIENIEHGRKRDGVRTRDITVDELIVLANALGVSPSVLLPLDAGLGYGQGEMRTLQAVMDSHMRRMGELLVEYYREKGESQNIFKSPDARLHPNHPETQPAGFGRPDPGEIDED